MISSFLKGVFFLLAIAILSCTTTPVQKFEGDTVLSLEKTVHFLSLDGENITVQPGLYQVMRSGNDSLWLTGEDLSNPILIAAHERINEESVSQPAVLSIREGPDDLYLLLLLPGGKGLEAVGSLTGIRSKGTTPQREISSSQISQSLQGRLPLASGSSPGSGLIPDKSKIISAITPEMELIEIWRYSPPNAAPAPEKLFATPPPTPKPKPGIQIKNLPWTLDGWDVDGPNTQFFFVWKPIPPSPSPGPFQKTDDTPGAVTGGGFPSLQTLGYSKVAVRVNGQVVPLVGQYGLQFGPGGTIITRPLLDARPQAWPISVSMQAETNQGKHVYSATSKVQVGKIWSWFERILWPIFTHVRCTSCHSVGDHNAIVKYHKDRNVQGVDPQDPSWKPHNPDFCKGCHGFITNEWFSPSFVQELNWTVAMPSARKICEKVTGPFTNKNGQVGPPLDLHYHFHSDPRIIWAVSDGTVPMGHPKKTVLFPGKKEEFFYKIDEWLNKGNPCPKSTEMDGQ